MAYIPVPANGSDVPAQSRSQIYDNFLAIQALVGVNHVPFGSGATEGMHKFVQLTQQAAKPTLGAAQMALYQKDVSGTPEMFIERADGSEVNITSAGANNSGWARLPSGILIKWGQDTLVPNTSTTKSFLTGAGVPNFNSSPWIIIFSAKRTNAGATPPIGTVVRDVTTAPAMPTQQYQTFGVNNDGSASTISYDYIAIGN